jgi:hypothetical protein
MKPPDIRRAIAQAAKNERDIRRVGEMPSYDMVILEDRATGERRRVPMKFLLMSGTHFGVAFEMVDPAPDAEEEAQTEEE